MNELHITKACASILQYLSKRNIEASQSSNFSKMSKAARKLRMENTSGQFRNSKLELHYENAFWLKFTKGNEVIAIVAARYEELGSRNLSRHWQDQQKRLYKSPNKIGNKHCDLSKTIKGNVAYAGEFYIKKSYHGQSLGGVMTFLCLMLARLRWRKIDWVYGLMDAGLVMNGYAARMGFNQIDPMGVDWKLEPEGISAKDWLVAVHGRGIDRMAAIIANSGPEELLPRKRI